MSNSKIPSPARSHGRITPRKYQPRSTRTRSVASPARSNTSTRLTALMHDAFHLSPISRRRSVLNDDTDVQEPLRKSWWKNLDENSRDMVELFQNIDAPATQNVLEEIDMETVSQEQNYSVDIPDSSDGESIRSIIVPQRKLFPRKEKTKQKYFEDYNNIIQRKKNKSSKSIVESDKDITIAPRNLFNQGENKSIPIFPAGLLNKICANTSVDASIELQVEAKKSRNLFGNQAGTKRKNTFIDFIASDNEDEINENQPKVFGFKRQSLLKTGEGSVINSPTSSILDIEEEWQLLPSSTMIGHPLDGVITPKRRKPSASNINKSHMNSVQKQKNKENNMNNTLVAGSKSKDIEAENDQTFQKNSDNTRLENKNVNMSANNIISNKNKSLNVSKTKNITNKDNNKEELHQTSPPFENQEKVCSENPNLSQQRTNQSIVGEKILKERAQCLEMHTKITNTDIELESEHDQGINKSKNNECIISPSNKNRKGNERDKGINRSDENVNINIEDELHIVVEQRQNASDKFIVEAVLESVNESNDEQKEQIESDIEHESDLHKSERVVEREESDIDKSISEIEQEQSEDEEQESEIEQEQCENEQESEIEQEQSKNEEQESEIEQEQSENEQQKSEIEQRQCEGEENENYEEEHENEIQEQQSETEQEQAVENEQIKQNVIRESDAHNSVSKDEDYENEIIDQIGHNEDIPNPHETKINETLKHPEAALNCKTNTISDSFLIDRHSLSFRKTKSVIIHHEPLQDRTGFSDETRDSSANNSGWDSHRTTRKTLRQTFGKDFTPRKSLRTLVMEKSAKRQTYNIADNIINGNKSKETIEIIQSLKDDQENQKDSNENVFEQSSNDREVSQAASNNDSNNENIAQMNNAVNERNYEEETHQGDDYVRKETDEIDNDETVDRTDNHHDKIADTNYDEEISQSDDSDHNEIEESNNDEENMVHMDDERMNQSDNSDRNEIEESMNDEDNETDNDNEEMIHTNDDEEINHSDESDDEEIGQNHLNDDEEINRSDESDDEEIGQNHLNDNEDISKMPQANSTEYPAFESMAELMGEDESIRESLHNKSQKKKKSMREVLEQIKAENMERKRKIDEEVDNWLKRCSKPSQNTHSFFKVPQKPAIRRPTKANKPKTIPPKNLPFSLPEEFLEDLKYKPPKRYQPKNAAWATKRLYAFLETKLEPKYDYKARVRAEKLVETIYNFTRDIRRADVAPPPAVGALKQEMARLNVVHTHFDFYEFIKTYMPRDVRNKVVPSITNKIALPKPSVFADILQ